MTTQEKFQQIDKEAIAGLKFPEEDILVDADAIKLRTADLQRQLTLEAKNVPNWDLYHEKKNKHGPLPTLFKFVKTIEYELIGNVVEPDPIRIHSDICDADVSMFNVEAIFTQKINRNTKKEIVVM